MSKASIRLGDEVAQKNPERIYNWMDSQLSIARFYGGIVFNGRHYFVDMGDPETPLVRDDVLATDNKKRKEKLVADVAIDKTRQRNLLGLGDEQS